MDDYQRRLAKLTESLRLLPDKPEETPESTLRALWMTAAGFPNSADLSLTMPLPTLDGDQEENLDVLIARRLEGVPLGHLTGRQDFMGLELEVGPKALLPRRETEILGRAAAAVVEVLAASDDRVSVVDTCCGCGNVALALASINPRVCVIGVDLSSEAVELARSNAVRLGYSDRVEFRVGDLFGPVDDRVGKTHLVTCNPPYISTANVHSMDDEIASYEPAMAFDGGPFGIKILRRLVKEAPVLLRPRGYLAFEVGLGQGKPMSDRIEKLGSYASVASHRDSTGAIRALVARAV